MIKNKISQSILYGMGPFFSYPWKPILNQVYGTTYEVAFEHFWQQHRNVYNLAWHFVCLFFQLFGNFGLLYEIDMKIIKEFNLGEEVRILSLLTSVLWILALIPNKCSIVIKLLSMSCIILSYLSSKKINENYEKIEIVAFALFFLIWLTYIKNEGFSIKKEAKSIIILFLIKLIISQYIIFKKIEYTKYTFELNLFLIFGIIILSLLKDPVKATIAFGTLMTHFISSLTNQKIVYLFGLSFVATGIFFLINKKKRYNFLN
jgi:hypothetical protein